MPQLASSPVNAPGLSSALRAPNGPNVVFTGNLPARRAAVQHVTDVPIGGDVTLKMRVFKTGSFDAAPVGCLNTRKLTAVERQITATAATSERVNDDGITAHLPRGSRGFAVIAVPAITGWQCSAGASGVHAGRSRLGLLAVPLPADGRATTVSCSFTPPGLHKGEAVAGLSLLELVVLAGFGRWRRRTAGTANDGGDSGAPPAQPEEQRLKGEVWGAGLTLRCSAAQE